MFYTSKIYNSLYFYLNALLQILMDQIASEIEERQSHIANMKDVMRPDEVERMKVEISSRLAELKRLEN